MKKKTYNNYLKKNNEKVEKNHMSIPKNLKMENHYHQIKQFQINLIDLII